MHSPALNDRDIRMLPAYGVAEAAHYLRMPPSTLRSWMMGARGFDPVFRLPVGTDGGPLSFVNLVEAHVLDAVRREHRISMQKVRRALRYLEEALESYHPLVEYQLETDGIDLFVEQFGQLINASRAGQLAIRKLLEAHLQRLDRDPAGFPIRLFPFTRKRADSQSLDEPRAVVIDPHVSFGRPVISGTGIPTAVIAERYKAGEAIAELAEDYGRESLEIEEAIRCELIPSRAA